MRKSRSRSTTSRRTARPAPRTTATPAPSAIAVPPLPEPDLARQRDRWAALARWNAERDSVAIEWQESGAGSARQQEAEALLDHIDAVRSALETDMVSAARLSTLERSLAAFRHAPQAARAGLVRALAQGLQPYRRGGAPGRRDALARTLHEILDRAPRSKLPVVWDRLLDLKGEPGSAIVSVYGDYRTGYVRWRTDSGKLRRTTAHRIGNRLAEARRRAGPS